MVIYEFFRRHDANTKLTCDFSHSHIQELNYSRKTLFVHVIVREHVGLNTNADDKMR